MSKYFLMICGYQNPILSCVGSGNHGEQTGKIMIEFEKVLLAKMPELVLVVANVMIDSLLGNLERAQNSKIINDLNLQPQEFCPSDFAPSE